MSQTEQAPESREVKEIQSRPTSNVPSGRYAGTLSRHKFVGGPFCLDCYATKDDWRHL